MADPTKASSFLGSLSPWSRSSTPPPKSPQVKPVNKPDGLRQSAGFDHAISIRPSPSLRRYPRDCPPLKARWYYAVDVAKRKPFASEIATADKTKPPSAPKKFVQFSLDDSAALEHAYQSLDSDEPSQDDSIPTTSTRVPVNEDYLFDVHIEKRELEPAYWLGPIYEVRRGSWFFQESATTLKPCDENLANQLEEGYLKLTPWRQPASARSQSQPRARPRSQLIEQESAQKPGGTATPTETQSPEHSSSNSYRLFGSWMNTTVTYQDDHVAYLNQDDFVSRMSVSVWERFGTYGGLKVVRGWSDSTKPGDGKAPDKTITTTKENRRSQTIPPESDLPKEGTDEQPEKPKKRTALERQISSLAGFAEGDDSAKDDAEKEAQEEQQREMEDAREKDGEDQARQIDHLVLVTHGIGQRLGLRLDSVNFVHDVNVMRKTMKAVYASAPDLQAVSGDPQNCRVQVLPVCWRHLLDFPKQSLKQNRKEFDLGDTDDAFEDEYPSLQDITVDGVPAVRNLVTDLAMDILLYQSAYREHIASIVQKECNRVHKLFKQRTGFKGRVSVCGHSLGSAICFDLLCRQDDVIKTRPRRVSSKTSKAPNVELTDLKLNFEVDNFFALGSPIALFQMLKGRTIAGRSAMASRDLAFSPFDPDPAGGTDPFDRVSGNTPGQARSKEMIPITTSSPKCGDFFNIFHPTDPIAYRVEPLISPAMAQLKPQPLPYTKKGLFGAPGIANISQRVGQSVMSSWYGLTSGVASTLINRSLGITGEEQALPQDKPKPQQITLPNGQVIDGGPKTPIVDNKKQEALAEKAKNSDSAPILIDGEIETLYAGFQKRRRSQASNSATADEPTSNLEYGLEQERARKLKREEAKVKALNSNGRVDYHIQEGMFDVSLLASIASHLSYWADEDCHHFMLGQMLKKGKMDTRSGGTVGEIGDDKVKDKDKNIDALSADIASSL